jgi:hypothetical protein
VCLYCAAFFSEDYDDEGVDAKNVWRGHTLRKPTRVFVHGKCQ